MRVSVTVQVRRPGIAAGRLREVVRHALRRQRCAPNTTVSVVLVSDRAIRRLNRRFLGINRPTDVLSFPLNSSRGRARRGRFLDLGARSPEPEARQYLGDIVISADRARVQARQAGHPVRSEVALLAVHGVLHLLGYDDHRPADAAAMARRQRTLVAETGFEVAG